MIPNSSYTSRSNQLAQRYNHVIVGIAELTITLKRSLELDLIESKLYTMVKRKGLLNQSIAVKSAN